MRINKLYQLRRLEKVINIAGPRYTASLNVDVSIAPVFDALGRTREFLHSIKAPAHECRKDMRRATGPHLSVVAAREFQAASKHCSQLVDVVLGIPNSGIAPIRFTAIRGTARRSEAAISSCQRRIQEASRKRSMDAGAVPRGGESRDILRDERYHLDRVFDSVSRIREVAESVGARALLTRRVLLTGMAGSGKTHFLCDLAARRITQGLPTLIFLGEEIHGLDPLAAISGLLPIGPRGDDVLPAFNRYCRAKRVVGLILVDAMNESDANVTWTALNRIAKFSHLGVVASVRTGFEEQVFPLKKTPAFVRVEHEGFAEHEWQAVTKYFTQYGLPLPEVPVLFPEFRIPLFLKIFCQAFSGSKSPIKGHFGFTHIFEQYVKRQGTIVLRKLNERADIGRSAARIWNGVVKQMASQMGQAGSDRISESAAEAIAKTQFPAKAQEALRALEQAWLIVKVPDFGTTEVRYHYRFPYQKFSDHLIVRSLLNAHLDASDPKASFANGPLSALLANQYLNRGLVEALSIQIPERLKGKELVHLTPKSFGESLLGWETFLDSLVLRDLGIRDGRPRFVRRDRLLPYINSRIRRFRGAHEQVLETILTTAAIPGHPFNAYFLHKNLSRRKLPERDSFWLPFVNSQLGAERAVDRLLNWAWDGGAKHAIPDTSLVLPAIALTWLLASSNRKLRDRATKALVSLLAGRLSVLIKVMGEFASNDDPYIQERIYAVAVGCALAPGADRKLLSSLAKQVYRRVFCGRKAPTHILLRDYARCVIEVAAKRDPILANEIDLKRVRPPYRSSFPKRAPTLAFLERRFPAHHVDGDGNGYWAIWHSLMHDNDGGLADFGRYVVNTALDGWKRARLDKRGNAPHSPKDMERAFLESLTRSQRKRWSRLEKRRRDVSLIRFLRFADDVERPPSRSVPQDAEVRIKRNEQSFIQLLTDRQRRLYRDGVLRLRRRSGGWQDLDYAAIQRIIFRRVIELGWTPQRFGEYERSLSSHERTGRKIERIGKKYQWIAFHEVLGRVADNFVYVGHGNGEARRYTVPHELRDIDPTCPLRRSYGDASVPDQRPWWISKSYTKWRPSLDFKNWARRSTDLPELKSLLATRKRGGWLLLDGYFRWEQPSRPGENSIDNVRRDVWIIMRSYLVRKVDAAHVFAWAKKQDFMGRWMPDPVQLHGVFLAEFPYLWGYTEALALHEHGGSSWLEIRDKEHKRTGFRLGRTTEDYIWSTGSADASIDDTIAISLPSSEMYSVLGLEPSVRPAAFCAHAKTVVMDPSTVDVGPSTVLVEKKAFMRYLAASRTELLWTLMGEKLQVGGMSSNFPGRLEFGGAYRMKADGSVSGRTYSKFLPER